MGYFNGFGYSSGLLAKIDRDFAEKRRRWAREDAAEGHRAKKNGRGSPLTDDPSDGPILSKRNSRGPDPFTRKIAWACEKSHEDMRWKDITKSTAMPPFLLKSLVKKYEKLGGMKSGTIMNSGELSMKSVSFLSKRMGLDAPCDNDLKRWLKTSQGHSFLTGNSKAAADVKEYAIRHGILQEGLDNLGLSLTKIKRVGMLLGKEYPTLDDVTTFFARYPDKSVQLNIALEKGVPHAVSLLKRLRERVPVPDEPPTEARLDKLAKKAEEKDASSDAPR